MLEREERPPIIEGKDHYLLGRQKAYLSEGDGKAIAFLFEQGGASLEQIAKATGWINTSQEITELGMRIARLTSDKIINKKKGGVKIYRIERLD